MTACCRCLTIDEWRIGRNSICWCDRRDSYEPNKCSTYDPGRIIAERVSHQLFSTHGKALVLFTVCLLASFAGWGVSLLEADFNPIWWVISFHWLQYLPVYKADLLEKCGNLRAGT